MSLAVMGLLAKYPKLASLADMANMKLNQLTPEHVARIAAAFDTEVPFTEQTVQCLIHLLKGRDINEVADLMQDPESIKEVVLFFTGGIQKILSAKQGDDLNAINNLYIGGQYG